MTMFLRQLLKGFPKLNLLFYLKDGINEIFRQRLQCAFAHFGLNGEDYCVILPRQDWLGYLNLNLRYLFRHFQLVWR